MNKLLLFLLSVSSILGAQEKQILWEESRSFYAGNDFTYQVNEDRFAKAAISWRLMLANKPLAEGRLNLQSNNNIKWELPKVKEGALIKGELLLQGQEGKQSYIIPYYVVGEKLFQYKHEKVFILTDQEDLVNEKVLNDHHLDFEVVNSREAVLSKNLILYNVHLYEDFDVYLSDFINSGGKVLLLGKCTGELDLTKFGIDKIQMTQSLPFLKSIKGLGQNDFDKKSFWDFNIQEKTFSYIDEKSPQFHYQFSITKGQMFCSPIHLNDNLNNSPGAILFIKKALEKRD